MNVKKCLINSLIFIIGLVFLGLFGIRVNAMDIYTDQSGEYSYQVNDIKLDFVTESTTVQEISGVSIRSDFEFSVNNYIIEADMSKNNNIKVATWAIQNNNKTGFSRAKLLDIAKDYEANHPGYVVLGGINADQYVTKFGTSISAKGADYYYPQSYYPMISSGDNYFAVTGLGVSSNVVGFKNDSSSSPLVNGQRTIKGLYLYVYDDESRVMGSYKVDSLNNMNDLKANETTLLAPIKTENNEWSTVNKNSSNSIYVVSDADLSYVSNSITYTQKPNQNADAFFGKGKIGFVDNSISITNNQFAIETTNSELKDKLSVGVYVKAQYEFDNDFQGIEEAIGYHTKQIEDGVDLDIDNSYNTRAYPRSLFGSDDTGNIYLWTTGGSNSSPTKGMYAQECNALASKFGITNLYQMDGGGSVSAVYRDSTGVLSYISEPIEGDYRANLSGLFIVQKEVEVDCELENVDDQTATFKLSGLNDTIYTGAGIELIDNTNSVIYTVNDDECIITNLSPSTTYNYRLYLSKDEESALFSTFITGTFTTLSELPIINNIVVTDEADQWKVRVDYTERSLNILKLYVVTDSDKYPVINNEVLIPKFENIMKISLYGKYMVSGENNLREITFNSSIYNPSIFMAYFLESFNCGIEGLLN